jgi:hypothetical protein
MTKELSTVLKALLTPCDFKDTIAGIVQPVIDVKFKDGDNTKIAKRKPVSYDTSLGASGFLGMERQLVPDKGKKSIMYFEDFGSSPDPRGRAGSLSFITNVRFVCWMNKINMGFEKYDDVTAKCIDQVLHLLITGQGVNMNGVVKLLVMNPRVLIQDANIFSRYNYDEAELQYLRPPYEYFAIDLTCRYELRAVVCLGLKFPAKSYQPVTIRIVIKDNPRNVREQLDNGWWYRLERPSGTTLTLSFLKGLNILAPFILNRNIVDGIVDNPIPFDEDTVTWDLSGHPLAAFNEDDEIFISASLPFN